MVKYTFLHIPDQPVETFLLNFNHKILTKRKSSGVIGVNFSPFTGDHHEPTIHSITPVEPIDASKIQIKGPDNVIDSNIPRKIVHIWGTVKVIQRGRNGGVRVPAKAWHNYLGGYRH